MWVLNLILPLSFCYCFIQCFAQVQKASQVPRVLRQTTGLRERPQPSRPGPSSALCSPREQSLPKPGSDTHATQVQLLFLCGYDDRQD